MEKVDIGKLCAFAGPAHSNVHASLRIPLHDKDSDFFEKLFRAEQALHDLGITFDAGTGNGFRDWEFDWSLSGAIIQAKTLWCMECTRKMSSGDLHCFVREAGNVDVFCSESCRQAWIGRHDTRPEGICLMLPMIGKDPGTDDQSTHSTNEADSS